MRPFKIHLTRYKNQKRRQSYAHFITAKDFSDAVDKANLLVVGSRDADPEAEFGIASIEATGPLGPTCSVGWVTSEEFEKQNTE